jgi:hypothetical protein
MSRLLKIVAAAMLVGASGAALAQQDAVNPAPNYSATPAVQNHQVKHIEDGVNAAPRYEAVAPVAHPGNATIQDGNNPAPVVQATTTQTPKARTRATAKSSTTVHARRHAHTTAGHG